MSYCGDVKKLYRRTYSGYGNLQTGVRTAKMTIYDKLPSFLRFGQRLARLYHRDQEPTCRTCNTTGHEAKSCTTKVCFNCEEHGHEARDCVEELKCSICRGTDHFASHCHFTWRFEDSHHRDVPKSDRPGTTLSSHATDVHDSQPLSPDADADAFRIVEINTNIVESNPPSELLTSAAVGNLFTPCQRVVRKPIRYVTIHF